jgi:aldose 1-epimerase
MTAPATAEAFGQMPDGTQVHRVALEAEGIAAQAITWGAVLQDLQVRDRAGRLRRVVLGLATLAEYLEHSRNFSAICGRVVNRISGATFTLDGTRHALDANHRGRNTLHGGAGGFSKRVWTLAAHDATSVTFAIHSAAGDQGFPGAVDATCTHRLLPPATLEVVLEATASAPTPVNLAFHPYFILDDEPTIDAHRLSVAADFFTPTDADGLPTGEVRSVAGTPYDFRTPRALRGPGHPEPGYDINLVLRTPAGATLPVPAARLESGAGDLALEIETTAVALQLFDGHTLGLTVPGLHGRTYGPRAGVALEPQNFPDAPNKPHFPSVTLRPGERFRQVSRFRFV